MVMHTYTPASAGGEVDSSSTFPTCSSSAVRSFASTQVGFVVSKSVGNAVVRNRVKRRFRHLVAAALTAGPDLPPGTAIVIRALPGAVTRPDLVVTDFDRAWRRSRGVRRVAKTQVPESQSA